MVEPSLSLREAVLRIRMTCIAIAYPNPAQPTVGVAIAVLNKMVDDTDDQKKVENAENETSLSSTRYTYRLIYDEFHRYPPV